MLKVVCLVEHSYIGEVLKQMLIHIDISGTNVDELQDNNSASESHTKLRYYLSSKRVNGRQKDWFSSVGARTGAIKLAMVGT